MSCYNLAMKPVRLLSLNVALFETNNRKLEKFLADVKPDIICLQEVTRKAEESTNGEYVSYDAINGATGFLPYSFYAPNWIMKDFAMKDFHGHEDFKADFNGFLELGNYCKSRYPILKGQAIFLQNHYTMATDWTNWSKEESRSVQVTDIVLESDRKLRIINYHGIWSRNKIGSPATTEACKKIRNIAKQVDYPSVIAGDFNLFPSSVSMEPLNDTFTSLVDKYNITTTRPKSNELSKHPRNVVDYIFTSETIKTVGFEVIENDVSDHLPLLATLVI